MLKKEIPFFKKEVAHHTDPIVRWEYLKYKCREVSKKYAMQKSKESKSQCVALEKKLTELENQLSTDSSAIMRENYKKCKLELDKLHEYITAGLILRSRANWYEYREKSSEYFLNLEKRNKAKSHVRTLVSDSGIKINDPYEILSCMRDFYSNLYKCHGMKTEKECLQYLYDLNRPQLSDQDCNSCEGLLTKKECWDSLDAMKNGKSPGNDGLSKEFYVCFFNELSDSLTWL